jgi:hypothetical protein
VTHGHNRTHALQHSGTLCGAFNTEIEFAVERPNRLVRQRLSAVLPSPAFRLRIAVRVLSQPLERIAAVRIDCAQPPCGQNISVADKQAASKFVSKRQATAVSSFGAALLLALRPTKLSGRYANELTELAGHVTLVGKAYGKSNL